jgi:hypothetical protein
MDFEVNENPEVEAGDLIFVDDLHRGRQLMVVSLSVTTANDDGTKTYYRYGLVDVQRGSMMMMLQTSAHLQKQIDNMMCSVYKNRDYKMLLRKK